MPEHNIFLVDDHPLLREGLTALLQKSSDLHVCGEAETENDAVSGIRQSNPDVAIVDLSLKEGSGFDLVKTIRQNWPRTQIVVLSMHDERRYAERALRMGARGYVMKSEATANVVQAVREVLDGKLYLSPQMREAFVDRFVDKANPSALSPFDVLTDRELEVFRLLGRGYETRKIATMLDISIKTVQTFCARMKEKLGLENASELLREAVRFSDENAPM
ncbi:MAG: response regulator transcription factor [Rhizomicrobium sp.]|jgi:DNA-binding NarL/FixJ family response regulator